MLYLPIHSPKLVITQHSAVLLSHVHNNGSFDCLSVWKIGMTGIVTHLGTRGMFYCDTVTVYLLPIPAVQAFCNLDCDCVILAHKLKQLGLANSVIK